MATPAPNTSDLEGAHQTKRVYNVKRVKACVTCRNLKIKCRMSDNGPPCERCRNRDSNCRVESNVQSLLHENTKWQNSLSERVTQLQTAVNVLLQQADLPHLSSYSPLGASTGPHPPPEDESLMDNVNTITQTIPIVNNEDQRHDEFYESPINSLYQITRSQIENGRSTSHSEGDPLATDFISRNILSDSVALKLFQIFSTRLDHFCYDIMCPHQTLESARKSSSLLVVAISTVAALHDPDGSELFNACHAEFLRLVTSQMFSHKHSIDDIRALIIGSYWLGNLSYTLTGHCIRAATALNYHLAYYSAIEGDRNAFDKARLWYILYIMDHHLSILYCRPAIISPHDKPYQQWENFIQSDYSGEPDVRMGSQVTLYRVTSKAKDIFGVHNGRVPEHGLSQLRSNFLDLDRWYLEWGNRMQRNAYVGNFPTDGAILHYHFARLHLCRYVFRGMTPDSAATASDQVREYAALAVSSGMAVIELVLEREDLRNSLVGMPVYFHAMITFAAAFLVKAASTNFSGLTIVDKAMVFNLLERCVREFRSNRAASQHLIYQLGNGLEDMILRTLPMTDSGIALYNNQIPSATTIDSLFMLSATDFFHSPSGLDKQSPQGTQYPWGIDVL